MLNSENVRRADDVAGVVSYFEGFRV